MKKIVVLLLCLVMVMQNTNAQGTIILVMGNGVELALAEVLAGAIGATVVEVEGFDEKILESIFSFNPDKIYVIGNTVEEMVKELEKNFDVEIIEGNNEMDLSLKIYKRFRGEFKEKVFVVTDMARESIEEGKRMAMKEKAGLLFSFKNLNEFLEEIKKMGLEYEIITSNKQTDLKSLCEKKFSEIDAQLEFFEGDLTEIKKLLERAKDYFENGDYLNCLLLLTQILQILGGG